MTTKYWHWRVALLVWMAFIFFMSGNRLSWQTTEKLIVAVISSTESTKSRDRSRDWPPQSKKFVFAHIAIRKFAHIIEYAILTYLWFRSLWTEPGRFVLCIRWSVLLSILYAMLDECYQYFLFFRDGKLVDVLWDSAGIAMMSLVLWYVKRTGKGKWILGANGSQQALFGLSKKREIS